MKKLTTISEGLTVAAIVVGVGAYVTREIDRAGLVKLARELDAENFGSWFRFNGVPYEQIAALWEIESAGNPRAVNFTGGDGAQGGSWGLGQVTARTSTDYGVIFPPLMLYPRYGARISMRHIQSTINRLGQSGVAGSAQSWVQAYNVGVAGFVSGRRNAPYFTRFLQTLEA